MVKYQENSLDRTFAALADPTRRALLARLGEQPNLSVSDLARPLPLSLPAVMKHLDVLQEAGLITRSKTGRVVSCELDAAPMQEAMAWLNRYERFWSDKLDRLAAFLEEDPCLPKPRPQLAAAKSPASRSSAASRRRPKKSFAPGPTRK